VLQDALFPPISHISTHLGHSTDLKLAQIVSLLVELELGSQVGLKEKAKLTFPSFSLLSISIS